jgi:aminoglycoside phosphotransferase (APT) family kinase protein
MHGDFHIGNVMVALDRPKLAGIVDWKMATIGDPLVDLGWLLATWPADDAPVARFRLEPWDGYPTRDQLIARYGERSARDLSNIEWVWLSWREWR